MAHYKVLVGCCLRQQAHVVDYYCRSLRALQVPRDAELRFGFIDDGTDGKEHIAALEPALVLPAEPRPPDAVYAITEQTHIWQHATFEHLARQKQRLLQYAIDAGYSHVFLVDSDILLESTTLVSLWETKCDITNAVFWTRWQPDAPPMPQCWLSHPYGMKGLGMEEHEFLGSLTRRQAVRCIGGGACTLMATDALKRGIRYHPRLPGLPPDGMWQGEDRTFALLAARNHERQLADGWPDVFHAYRMEQRTPEALEEAWTVLSAPRQTRAKYGDMVSLTLDPLEDPPLATSLAAKSEMRCIRGRLGGLPLAPELESAILDMAPGDIRLINMRFPMWHPIEVYRGHEKVIKLMLVDVKPYSYAPVLAEAAFAGVGHAYD